MNYKYRIIAIITWIALVILSVMPLHDVPQVPVWEADKWGHLIAYTILTILVFLGAKENSPNKSNKKTLISSIIVSFLTGFVLECIQGTLLPYRFFDILDLIANIIGVLTGAIILGGLFRHSPSK